jgi:SnoaL-like domain
MDNQRIADRMELYELANKLFMYVDAQEWDKVLGEVLTENVWFDMQSAGAGEPRSIAAKNICAMWKDGFADLDAVHHQGGQYLITVHANGADIFGYAVAFHYKQSAQNGKTRTFVGSYDLKAINTEKGWRLNQFKYNLKYIDGNQTME